MTDPQVFTVLAELPPGSQSAFFRSIMCLAHPAVPPTMIDLENPVAVVKERIEDFCQAVRQATVTR